MNKPIIVDLQTPKAKPTTKRKDFLDLIDDELQEQQKIPQEAA